MYVKKDIIVEVTEVYIKKNILKSYSHKTLTTHIHKTEFR